MDFKAVYVIFTFCYQYSYFMPLKVRILFSRPVGVLGTIIGVSIYHNKDRKVWQTTQESGHYLRMLVNLYRFLGKSTPPLIRWCWRGCSWVTPTSHLCPFPNDPEDEASWWEAKTAVVVGTITNEAHVQEVPKLKMCALCVSSCPQSQILESRSKILTFRPADSVLPQGQCTVLLSGPCKGQEVYRHFSKAPGTPHRHNKPYLGSKGWKYQCAKGQQVRCGYKN